MKVKIVLVAVSYLVILQTKQTNPEFRSLILERQTLQGYCSSLRSCNNCKNGPYQCEWCHEIGCTTLPRLHCPKKLYLDNILRKDSAERFCTEIVSKSPIYVPADVKRIIKLDLKVDDMTLYERNIVCEIKYDKIVLQVKAVLEKNTVSCDATNLNIEHSMGLGSIKLIWGGVEPYSNMILIVVYKCRHLAQSCMECQALSKEFQCGWCKELSICNLLEECPRHYGPWIDKKYPCKRYNSKAFAQFHDHYGHWY